MYTRIIEVRKRADLTQTAFGEVLGVSRAVIASIETGRVTPTNTFVQLLCIKFHVREEWLREGKGEMYEPDKPDDVDSFLKSKGVTGVEADLFKAYISLPKDLREKVIACFNRYFEEKKAAAPPGGSKNADDGSGR